MSRLRLHVEGAPGAVPLDVFVRALNRSRLILDELDVAISATHRRNLTWRIVDLGIASADALIEAAPPRGEPDLPVLVASQFINGLSAVDRPTEAVYPAYFSEQALKRVKGIAKDLSPDAATGFTVEDIDRKLSGRVSERAAANVSQLIAPRYSALGSVVGTLEVISIHRKSTYNVYEARTLRAVRCDFDGADLESVKSALGRRVIVEGTVKRNAHGDAIRVEQPTLTLLPPDEELPPTSAIAGLVPDFTGDIDAGEYVRELRS
ncbi:MAG TPA: hypothetical protein VMA83_11125 [Solirubrobacteraceae bacterium]|nr:hypothetical protein [Solirubrobacteraceae bacterium]